LICGRSTEFFLGGGALNNSSPSFVKEGVGGWLPVITPDHPQPG
jgi:hypothetical protein